MNLNLPLRSVLLFSALLFSYTQSFAEDVKWFPYPETGVNLGQGFDLLTGAPTPASCVEFVANHDLGLHTEISFTEINSFVDTMSSMKVSGSGKLKMALLDAEAKLKIANETKVTRSFKDIGVNARVFLGASYAAPTKDRKYRPNSQGEQVGVIQDRADAAPAITFTDMALNAWPGLTGVSSGVNVSAYTICGSGYVSTVIKGVELNAILNTEDSEYNDKANFSGELKADILGGLAEINADTSGESASKTKFESIKVNAQITGKEDYSIPLNGNDLQVFLRDLPKDLKDSARPILIGVTPYGNLFPEVAGAYTTASDFSVLVDAWFTTREARARILEVIRNYGPRTGNAKSYFLTKSHMHQLVEETYYLEAEIQSQLQTLFDASMKENSENSNQPQGGILGSSPDTIFTSMVAAKSARERRIKEEQEAEIQIIDRETLQKLNAVSKPQKVNGVAGEISQTLNRLKDSVGKIEAIEARLSRNHQSTKLATNLYIAALLAGSGANIDLEELLTEKEKSEFGLALHILVRGEEALEQDIQEIASTAVFSQVAMLLGERDQCIANANRQYLEARQRSAIGNGTRILAATAEKLRKSYEDRIKVCAVIYEQHFEETVARDNGKLSPENADQDIRYLSRNHFIDVISRHVYENHFLPIKVSACESEPKSTFCSIDSIIVRGIISDLIVVDSEYVSSLANPLFNIDISGDTEVPVDRLIEIQTRPKPPRRVIIRDRVCDDPRICEQY